MRPTNGASFVGWASLLGLTMLVATPGPKSLSIPVFLPIWRETLHIVKTGGRLRAGGGVDF